MSVGYADDEEADAADALGSGRPDLDALMADALPAEAPPDVNAADIPLTAEPDLATVDPFATEQQGALGADGPHTPVVAGSNPAPATTDANGYPLAPQFAELALPPPPPEPTGDPQKDVAANLMYQRSLVAHHGELTKRQTALAEHAAAVGAMRGQKEAEVAAVEAREKAAEVKRAAEVREQRRREVDQAVAERVAAAKDVEGAKFDRPHTGSEIAAIILGAIGSTLQNVGAAQMGVAGNAQNEALKGIHLRMEREYEAKKNRLKAAGDHVTMARYEAKDAEEAHRAGLNDINADIAAKYKLIAKQAEEAVKQQGGTIEQAKGNAITVSALQEAAKHEGEIANREEGHEDQRNQAHATLQLARANLGERRIEHRDTLDDRRQARADARADRADKADEKKAAAEQNLAIRDGSGVVRGLAPSSRVVKPIQDRVIQYDDAIKSAEDLLAYRREHNVVGRLPTGDAYDRAVLAVAATTQANASDSTTAHEAGTLKKMGLVDEGAIEKTLEHLRERQAKFMNQLTPLEPGERKAGNRVSLPGKEPAPAPARGGGKPAVDEAKIDRAYKVMSDPKQSPEERKGAKNFLIQQGKL